METIVKNLFFRAIIISLSISVCSAAVANRTLVGPNGQAPPPGFSPILPRDPEVPWQKDPDISAIKDERIVQLWEDIMIPYRRSHPTGSLVTALYLSEEYQETPNTPENQEILINALSSALSTDPVDWNYVRTVLALMQKGMALDSRILQLADQLFTAPRNIKMSTDYGMSIRAMFHVLEHQKTKETAELLYKACSREYWGDDPMHTPSFSKEHSEESIIMVRRFALHQLALKMPAEFSIPLLEQLSAAYPQDYVPPEIVVEPADRFKSERRERIDFSRTDIDLALSEAYKALAEESGK